jgi:hypothetical protein
LVWGYEHDYPFARNGRRFAEAGIPFYVCPGTSSWRTVAGNTENCLGNQRNAARNGVRLGAEGYLNTDWGDGGHYQHQPVSYPGFAMGAALSWAYRANRDLDWAAALDAHAFRDPAGVMGALVLDLGRIQDAVPFAGKGLPLAHAFLAPRIGESFTGSVTRSSLRTCLRKLDALEAELDVAAGCAPDNQWLRAEMRNTIHMLRHGARRGLAALGAAVASEDLALERRALTAEHARIWHARNRRGAYFATQAALRRAEL